MGIYFNPSNDSFRKDRNYKIYVDKTELLNYTNEWLGTPRNCIAVRAILLIYLPVPGLRHIPIIKNT